MYQMHNNTVKTTSFQNGLDVLQILRQKHFGCESWVFRVAIFVNLSENADFKYFTWYKFRSYVSDNVKYVFIMGRI